jgi:hypothetical protein
MGSELDVNLFYLVEVTYLFWLKYCCLDFVSERTKYLKIGGDELSFLQLTILLGFTKNGYQYREKNFRQVKGIDMKEIS